jgi:hypothetical protein
MCKLTSHSRVYCIEYGANPSSRLKLIYSTFPIKANIIIALSEVDLHLLQQSVREVIDLQMNQLLLSHY